MTDFSTLRERIAFGLARATDFEGVGRADVVAMKSDPELTRYSFVPSGVVTKAADGEEETREATWVASDESADSMGDIIRVAGWDLKRYKANPVLLWGHDSNSPPVGLVHRMRKGVASDGRPALMATGSLFDKDVDEFADRVWRIMEAGGLPGVSVGFRAGDVNDPGDEDERKALGLGAWGLEFTKGHELLELSVVPVPANQNALRERCLKSADAEIDRWVRDGESTPAFVRDFRKSLLLTEEQIAARTREQSRKSVAVIDWQTRLDEAGSREEELRGEKRMLGATVSSLLTRETELKAEASHLEGRVQTLEAKNTELLGIREQLQNTVEQHRKGRGEDEQQPLDAERDSSEQQPPSSERRDMAALATAFAAALNNNCKDTD